jgi:HK97 family phage portal protein
VSLANNPEIAAGVDTIARLVGSMTIHLMECRDGGAVRIQNELSRKIDINPNQYMTRAAFIHWIVRTMYLEGNGNAVVWPKTRRGIIQDLNPVPPSFVSFIPDGWGYRVVIAGQEYRPDKVLHFALNPDSLYPWLGTGYRVSLADVANNLKQAAATQKGFMASKWKPSLIVKVDALTDEFSSPEGRKRLLEQYAMSGQAGEPWMIPAEQFSVEQVKPLTLSDLALDAMVTLDKRTVAAVLGIPAFVLGVGEFDRDAWNNFINTTIMPLARGIEQELTKKLLLSPEWFFRFNNWSLFSYSITELVSAGAEMVDRMALRRNEWRGWLNLPPDPEMDELLALENYLPADRLGDQGKLVQGGE